MFSYSLFPQTPHYKINSRHSPQNQTSPDTKHNSRKHNHSRQFLLLRVLSKLPFHEFAVPPFMHFRGSFCFHVKQIIKFLILKNRGCFHPRRASQAIAQTVCCAICACKAVVTGVTVPVASVVLATSAVSDAGFVVTI